MDNMKRELKYRAWDKSKLAMRYLHWGDFIIEYSGISVFSEISGDRIPKEWPLMECTFVRDENGDEIYEGDILQNGDYYKVEYSKDRGAWELNNHRISESLFLANSAPRMRIVGNIYSDPNLL